MSISIKHLIEIIGGNKLVNKLSEKGVKEVKLLEYPHGGEYANPWNFGPITGGVTAGEVADILVNMWGSGSWVNIGKDETKHESGLLVLDCSAAKTYLKWKPVYDYKEALSEIVNWFKEYARQNSTSSDNINMYNVCVGQIGKYTEKARQLGLDWANYKIE